MTRDEPVTINVELCLTRAEWDALYRAAKVRGWTTGRFIETAVRAQTAHATAHDHPEKPS